jgi:hypothetical protein
LQDGLGCTRILRKLELLTLLSPTDRNVFVQMFELQRERLTPFQDGLDNIRREEGTGSRNVAAVFAKTLREKVVINEHGQRKTITKLEAAVKQFVNKAAGGDLRALQMLVNLSREAETRELSPPERSIIAEVDQRVMEGIVRRFQPANQIEGEANDKPERE